MGCCSTLSEAGAQIGAYTTPIGRCVVASGPVTVGVRPEGGLIVGEGEQLPVSVNMIEALGSDGFIYGSRGLGGTLGSS